MNARTYVLALTLLTACAPTGEHAPSLRVELELGLDSVELLSVTPTLDAPTALDGAGDLLVHARDASGRTLLEGRVLDRRRVWAEASDETIDPTTLEGPVHLDGAVLALVIPRPESGRAELMLELDTPSGERVERVVELIAPESEIAPRMDPLIEHGDVGARREAEGEAIECPTQSIYRNWPGVEGSEERASYHGCGTMLHLGGAEDPSEALLVLVYPGGGWAGDLEGFRAAASRMVESALADNDWMAQHASRLSFYALMDETVADHTTIDCSVGGLGQSMNRMETDYWYRWRHAGAQYGPVARGNSLVPDVFVALKNGYCDGFANDASAEGRMGPGTSTHILLGTTFGCYNTRTASCPPGARLAHELGHALGGLADAYHRCSAGYGQRYPNIQPRDSAEWSCYVGLSPPLECPDHEPPVRASHVRLYPEDGGCAWARPCGEDLMRGFYGSRFQFDPISAAAMTRALALELGITLSDGLPACTGTGTCAPSCEGVDCGLDGCDGTCACSCEGTDRACETALSTTVCGGTAGCTRTRDLAAGQCSRTARGDTLYVRATCGDAGWTTTDCTVYDEVTACLSGG